MYLNRLFTFFICLVILVVLVELMEMDLLNDDDGGKNEDRFESFTIIQSRRTDVEPMSP